jgi:sulfinoalanine decarboxylase
MCRQVLRLQAHCHHPHFHNQLFGGFSQFSLAGDMLTSAMNGSMYTYELAPCFLLMEQELFGFLKGRLGWPHIEGIMGPGGSYANFLAIVSARFKAFPEVKAKGLWGLPRMRILSSEQGHYSIKKHAMACGLGTESVVPVPSDSQGRMVPAELDRLIREIVARGEAVIMVNATVGTTVLGANDPLAEVAGVCKAHGIWMHVDGAFGGTMVLSDRLRALLPGIELADSFTWDPHKGLEVPLQATVYVHRHAGVLRESNSAKAGYLFHRDRDSYDASLDTGDSTLQCGRHIDILKVWTYFKGKGTAAIAQGVETNHGNAQHAAKYAALHKERFELVAQPQSFACCFYYIPERMRGQERDAGFYQGLGRLAVKAKKLMLEQGRVMVGYSELPGNPHYFWRLITNNSANSPADVEFELEQIAGLMEQAAG